MARVAVIVGGLIVALALASTTAAKAQAHRIPPWCAYMGGQFGFDCSYYTFEQCMETARGLGNSCAPNPRLQAVPRPPRRQHRVRNW